MANAWSHWGNGHLIFEGGEWQEVVQFVSTGSYSLFRPSTATVSAGPKDLTLYPPHYHRPRSLADVPPKP